ncbi:MAG TPA: APC family permease [Polyangiaceae bacterium]|nr:APC family permease [Polyangiaceae bacterium]
MASTTPESQSQPALARTMGLWALVIYGVGDMLGSGIYALIGKAAGLMGNAVWLAFVVSMIAALFTGLSYASLGSRYPRAAGAAYVAHRAFGFPLLTYVLGLSVVASGLTSFATQSRAFAGYFLGLTGWGPSATVLVALGFIAVLTFVNFWGMRESTALNVVCTTVEASGLLIVLLAGLRYWGSVDYLETPIQPNGMSGLSVGLVLQGGVLTFFSFVGFEDMINVAEEVKNPRKNFPLAVVIALAFTTVIYIGISITAVSVVPYAELGHSTQPLVDVVRKAAPGFPPRAFSFIALFAIVNTGLLNYIMGSRLVYGLARQGFVPSFLGRIHRQRRTPHFAILTLMCIVTLLALSGGVAELASATSVLLLTAFIIVNGSLIALKRRKDEPPGAFEIPSFIPALGIVACAAMLLNAKGKSVLMAGLLLAVILVLYLVLRPKVVGEPELESDPSLD